MLYQALRMHTCMPHLGSVVLLVLTGTSTPTISWRIAIVQSALVANLAS